jgi:hypothetical protein
MPQTSQGFFITDGHVEAIRGLAEEARLRRDAERSLEVAFLKRLHESPERLGLQTCLDVHASRRLEADLACERLQRLLDEARAVAPTSSGEKQNIFAALVSKRA